MNSGKMTWTLNTIAVGVVGAALLLPEPSEIRSAFEYGKNAQPQIEIIAAPEAAIVQMAVPASSNLTAVRVQNDPLETCLTSRNRTDLEAIQRCIPQFTSNIEMFDRAAQRRIEAGFQVMPDPRIEQQRLEIAELCRLKWAGTQGTPASLEMDACSRIISGVAY